MRGIKTIVVILLALLVFSSKSMASLSHEPLDNFNNMEQWYQELGEPFSKLQGSFSDQFVHGPELDEVLAILNQEMRERYKVPAGTDWYTKTINLNGEELKLNTYVLKTRGLVVYGSIHGDYREGHHRYLGYSRLGAKVTNRFFPIDMTVFNFPEMKEKGWIISSPLEKEGESRDRLRNTSTWENPTAVGWEIYQNVKELDYLMKTINPNYAKDPTYQNAIIHGLKHLGKYGGNVTNIVTGVENDPAYWARAIAPVELPTSYTWGTGNMFRIHPGETIFRYRTIPLMPYALVPPEPPDLSVRIDRTSLPANTKGGQSYTARVTYTLADDIDYEVTARLGLEHNGHAISGVHGQVVKFQPGESKAYTFNFTGIQNTNSTLLARIWPVSPSEDKNWANNRDEVVIPTEVRVDLAADLEWKDITLLPGKTATLRGYIINNGNTEQSTNYIWRIGNRTHGPFNITVPAGQRRTVTINYTAPNITDVIEYYLHVNPNRNRPANESNWSNNKTSTNDIQVIAPPEGRPGGGTTGPILVE